MSDKKPDGGPAFPHSENGREFGNYPGMSLRDYFAGQALARMPLRPDWNYPEAEIEDGHRESEAMGVATASYRYADAMLKARQS